VKGRVLGFDYGLKRIGTATGNLSTGTTQPLETLPCPAGRPDWRRITGMVREWRADLLVVGLPLLPDGGESEFCRSTRKFAAALESRTSLPVVLVDERFSSVEADHLVTLGATTGKSRRRRREAVRDSVAAELIVRTYLAENPAP
jgi:putative Holliday junction resolvase